MTLVEDAARTTRAPDAAAVPVAGLDDLGRLRAENTMLQETVAMLLARVAELERRLGLNRSNSGKPPSSDGLHKPKREPRTRSLREPSGKPPGGQKGHKGSTLRQVDAPNHMVEHYPEACPACGSALTAAMSTGHSVRPVFDLPEPQPLAVTEHHLPLRALRRADTGRVSRWGHSAGAIWSTARGNRGLPAPLPTSAGGSAGRGDGRPVRRQAGGRHHRPDEPKLCRARPGGRRRRLRVRESGSGQAPGRFRIGGRTQWLHIACTVWLVFYRVSPRRGSLMEGVTGIVVHDYWKPYYTMEGVAHALPTTCANSRLWSRSRRRTGRAGCSACYAAPATLPTSPASGTGR
jgi:transposase